MLEHSSHGRQGKWVLWAQENLKHELKPTESMKRKKEVADGTSLRQDSLHERSVWTCRYTVMVMVMVVVMAGNLEASAERHSSGGESGHEGLH